MIGYSSLFWRSQQVAGRAQRRAPRGVMSGATAADVTASVDQTMLQSGMSTATTVTAPLATRWRRARPAVKVTVPYASIKLTGFPCHATQVARSVTMAKEQPELTAGAHALARGSCCAPSCR
jgi:hypothetical protein